MLLLGIITLVMTIPLASHHLSTILIHRIAFLITLYSSILSYNTLYVIPLSTGIGILGGLFQTSLFSQSLEIFILIIGSIILLIAPEGKVIKTKLVSFYNKNISLQDMISKMIAKTNDVLSPYQEEREKKQLSVHQLMTMASLVEEEATGDVDREKIASVFYNRLAKNMPLQTDPTVLYAMKQHKEKVVYKDLKVNSPYNTYKHKGLPPGPIGSPGEKSIQAALKPAKTDYLYFLANIHTGKVYFAKTLKEHNALKEKYISKKD